jgi:hypothetical protein
MHGTTPMHPTLITATDKQLQPLRSDQQQTRVLGDEGRTMLPHLVAHSVTHLSYTSQLHMDAPETAVTPA